MQTYQVYQHFCQVEEVKIRQNRHIKCYPIVTGLYWIHWLTALLFIFSFDSLGKKFIFTCRYGMNTSCCRAKLLVEYFGEDFSYDKCQLYVIFLLIFSLSAVTEWISPFSVNFSLLTQFSKCLQELTFLYIAINFLNTLFNHVRYFISSWDY